MSNLVVSLFHFRLSLTGAGLGISAPPKVSTTEEENGSDEEEKKD